MTLLLRITFTLSVIAGFVIGFNSVRAQVNVSPQAVTTNVTLVWEAQSYTPPFYKGKSLYVDGADVNIFAFPPAQLGDPTQLGYIWKVDGVVKGSLSGVGERLFAFRPGMFGGSHLIVVDVYQGNTKVGAGAIRVPHVKPSVVLYPALPLAGILFGVNANSVDGDEITLEAYPLFFGVTTKADPALTYRWSVNGAFAENPLGNAGRLVLRTERGGDVGVGLSVSNSQNILERASASTNLTFEE